MREIEYNGKIIRVYEANRNEDVEEVIKRIDDDLTEMALDDEKPKRYKQDHEKIVVNGEEVDIRRAHYYYNYPVVLDTESTYGYLDVESHRLYSSFEKEIKVKDKYNKQYKYWFDRLKSKKRAERKATVDAVQYADELKKTGLMYIWQMAFGIRDTVIIGRTEQEWVDFLITLKNIFGLDALHEMVIYVHNLKYDFSFFYRNFIWDDKKSFMTKDIVYYASTKGLYYVNSAMPRLLSVQEFSGFLFRDSLCLAGVKEADLPKIMTKYNDRYKKLSDEFNYDLMRHPKTPLTDDELRYCIVDVLLLTLFIKEKMEEYGDEKGDNIVNIPITRVGEVRRQCSRRLFYNDPERPRKNDYKKINYDLFLATMKMDYMLYRQIRQAFQGGYTHANYTHVGDILYDVMSADISSSYPSCIVCKKFPISPYKDYDIKSKDDFNYFILNYSCLFDVTLYDVRPKLKDGINYDYIDSILSYYKIEDYGKAHPNYAPKWPDNGLFHNEEDKYYLNNGRVRYADRITITMNEIDWKAFCKFYDFDRDKVKIHNFKYANKGYLPKALIEYVLELYENKCLYKEFDGTNTKEGLLYRIAKVYINCLYGMTATNPLKESYTINEFNEMKASHYGMSEDEKAQAWSKELEEKTSFLCYQWSHVLTSHARMNLFKMIEASGYNSVYSDTDSNYFIKNDKTLAYIEKYNEEIDKEMNECFEHYKLPKDKHKVKGKALGHFEIENGGKCYKRFVTVGAKRYLKETDKGVIMTVAGLSKKAVDYLEEKYGRDKMFEMFSEGNIKVPAEYSGRMAATYIDSEREGWVKDYRGLDYYFGNMSSVFLEKVPFDMNECEDFEKILQVGEMQVGL